MTKPTMTLAELAEKGPDADLLREMIRYVVERVMEMDVEGMLPNEAAIVRLVGALLLE